MVIKHISCNNRNTIFDIALHMLMAGGKLNKDIVAGIVVVEVSAEIVAVVLCHRVIGIERHKNLAVVLITVVVVEWSGVVEMIEVLVMVVAVFPSLIFPVP